ncbi:MAG: hypothetical protein ACTSXD_06075, partial [Candidatus Heimdallarchaeaceae archaeon]
CNEYRDNYGLISLPYTSAGSGWWRIRNVHACAYKNILLCSEKDSENMDISFQLHDKIEMINKFNNQQLDKLAERQSEWFRSHISTKENLYNTFENEIIKGE